MEHKRVSVRIKGRVQGVFFRQSTRSIAREFQINGWVRNLPDGDVEAVFEGSPLAINKMLEWCNQGPVSAHVEKVIVAQEEWTGEFDSFRIK